jgi:hypothetical protein
MPEPEDWKEVEINAAGLVARTNDSGVLGRWTCGREEVEVNAEGLVKTTTQALCRA